MWRLWHRLFGWDYVVMEAEFSDLFGNRWRANPICRVHEDTHGRRYVRYGDQIVFLPKHARLLTR